MATKDHGRCKKCYVDLNGGSIWESMYEQYRSVEEADRAASNYGASKEGNEQWGRQVGQYDMEKDMTVSFSCPDCGYTWDRFTGEEVKK